MLVFASFEDKNTRYFHIAVYFHWYNGFQTSIVSCNYNLLSHDMDFRLPVHVNPNLLNNVFNMIMKRISLVAEKLRICSITVAFAESRAFN